MPSTVETEEPAAPQFRRLRAAVERIPAALRLPLGLMALFLFAFAATVLPLFLLNQGTQRAEIAGMQSSSGVAGQVTTIDLGIDNVGDTLINPICLSALFDLPVQVQKVTFQGLDTVAFKDGRACGGALSGSETISVRLILVPQRAGTIHMRLVASKGDREVGPAVERILEVAPR